MPLKYDYSNVLHEDPNQALEHLAGEIEDRTMERARSEYAAHEGQQTFWREFYERHPTLRAHRETVAQMLSEHWNELADMPAEQAVGRLAELAQERIDYLERTKDQRAEAAVMVGGPGLEGKPAAEQPVNAPNFSLGSIIKKRRQARRDAGFSHRRAVSE